MTRTLPILVILILLAFARPALAQTCAASAVLAPDSTSLSIAFDSLVVSGTGPSSTTCAISVPLNLPQGYSLGVYRVDYRGYAHLAGKESATLSVRYDLGPKGNGRRFKRSVKGATDSDFLFTENIGAGQMKRVGCGVDAVFSGTFGLTLDARGAPINSDSQASLDSSDGTAKHGLVFLFDLKKC